MTRKLMRTTRFKRDLKRELKSSAQLMSDVVQVLNFLVEDDVLPKSTKDHALSGDWTGYRDCHVKPDLVLIYRKLPGILELARLGSHSELF